VPDHPTPVQRVLDAAQRKGVTLDVVSFDDSTHTAQDAARAVGAELGQIVKSIVFVADRDEGPEPCLVLVSGVNRVDLSLLSAVLTEPRMRRATAIEAHELTGFSIGGIPPFGHVRPIRTIMDPDLGRYETVWAAAGTANAVFPMTPATLRVMSHAVVTEIAARPDEPRASSGPAQPVSDTLPPIADQLPTDEPTEHQAAGAPSGA
jgi:prolyl-tRNA editing enzyme YbaK/EbsC (Cys-tRNA(Pro) deacylase)